jgi:hypothetical protein
VREASVLAEAPLGSCHPTPWLAGFGTPVGYPRWDAGIGPEVGHIGLDFSV